MSEVGDRAVTGGPLKTGDGPHVARRKRPEDYNVISTPCLRCRGRFETVKRGPYIPSLCEDCVRLDTPDHRWCIACREVRPMSAYYSNRDANSDRRRCSDCYVRKASERYVAQRSRTDALKLERGCVDDGYNAHPAALDFDHLPGVEKRFPVGGAMGRRWEIIEAEIAKCEVVCANCHRVRTVARRAEAKHA